MAFLLALLATLVAVPLVIRLSPRLGLVDLPGSDPLKIHRRPVPRGGGLAVAVGLAVGMVAEGVAPRPLLLGGGVALALGLADDRWGLSPRLRLLFELAIAFAVSLAVVGSGAWARFLVGIVVIIVAINAANLFDGMDGLLPGTGALSAGGLAMLTTAGMRGPMWALAGALVGFLLYNRPPARIFLGDGGSYLVGTILGVGLIGIGQQTPAFLGGVMAFGMIGADFVLTLVRRGQARGLLFAGDRGHLYDQLLQRGWSTWRVLLWLTALQALLVLVGIGTSRLEPVWAAVALSLLVVAGLSILWVLGFVAANHPWGRGRSTPEEP